MHFYIPKKIKLNSIQIGIICGGYGSRLKKINHQIPKLFTRLYNRKSFYDYFLEKKIRKLKKKTIFLTNIDKVFQNKILKNKDFFLISELERMGTAGSLLQNLKYFQNNFIVLYGDIFFEDDLKDILEYHKKNKNDVTIHVHKKKNIDDVNLISVKNNKINKIIFNKKGKYKNLVNLCIGGIYVFKKSFLSKILNKIKKFPNYLDLEKVVFSDKENFKNYKINFFFSHKFLLDFGTVSRLSQLNYFLKNKKKNKKTINFDICFKKINNINLSSIQKKIKKLKDWFNYFIIININFYGRINKIQLTKKIDSYFSKYQIIINKIEFKKKNVSSEFN